MADKATLFTNTTNDPTGTPNHQESSDDTAVDYLDSLVGPGRKYATPADLAKAYKHSSDFIDRLKEETGGLRQELKSRSSLEELVAKLAAVKPNLGASNQDATHGSDERHEGASHEIRAGLTQAQVAELVRNAIHEDGVQQAHERNLRRVSAEMQSAWGPGYLETLRQTQKKLGVDEATLDHLAKTSPDLFLSAVLGAGAGRLDSVDAVTPPRSAVNSASTPSASRSPAGQENWKYFENLRKTNPEQYRSAAVQNRMFELTAKGLLDVPGAKRNTTSR